MADSPLVSVLMTSYNREKYIAESIQSVLDSGYKNFELIILDDGSKDRTVEIARSFESKDSRVKVFVNEENLGDYPNRNKAASLARGKYLKYVDSDDIIYPHGLQVMVEAMEKYPDSAIGFPRSNQPYGPHPVTMLPAGSFKEHFLKEPIFEYAPNSAIIRRDAFEKEGGFTEDKTILNCALGDFDMWLRLAIKQPIVFFVGEVVWGRVHGEQESFYKQKSYTVSLKRYQMNKQYLMKAVDLFSTHEFKLALQRLNQNHSRYILKQLFRHFDFKTFLKLYKESGIGIHQLVTGFKGYDQKTSI